MCLVWWTPKKDTRTLVRGAFSLLQNRYLRVLSTLFPSTPPRIAPATPPITAPLTLSRLVTAPITAPAPAPMAASRLVCFTTVVGREYVPLEDELDRYTGRSR